MEFSFVDAAPARVTGNQQQPQQPHQAAGAAAHPPAPRPLLQIPTWQEVQAAQQPAAPTILFRPSGLVAAARQQDQQHAHVAPQAPAQAAGGRAAPGPLGIPSAGTHGRVGGPTHPPSWQAPVPAPGPAAGLGPAPRPGGAYSGGYGAPAAAVGAPGGPGSGGPPPYGAPPRPGAPFQAPPGLLGSGGPAPPPNVVLVNRRQQGNPVLKHIRNVRWQFADIVTDYQLGQATAALFLSLRYHLLHPEYILHRIREQQRMFRLTVLLVHVDVEDVVKPLGEVTRAAVVGDCTLVCAWSPEECARWLETFKSYESKPASAIQERVDPDYVSRLAAVLAGSVRGINRTDSHTLGTSFGSLAAMMKCKDPDVFSACPGIGPTKVRRLLEAFHEPFRKQLRMTGAAAGQAGGAGPAAGGIPPNGAVPGSARAAATAGGPGGNPPGAAGGSARGPGGAGPSSSAAEDGGVPPAATGSRAGAASGSSGGPAGRERSQAVAAAAAGGGGAAAAVASGRQRADSEDPQRGPDEEVSEDEGAGGGEGDEEDGEEEGDAAGTWRGDGDGEESPGSGGLGTGGMAEGREAAQVAGGGQGEDAPAAGQQLGFEGRRQELLELLMSQMPAGDDDVSDVDEEYL